MCEEKMTELKRDTKKERKGDRETKVAKKSACFQILIRINGTRITFSLRCTFLYTFIVQYISSSVSMYLYGLRCVLTYKLWAPWCVVHVTPREFQRFTPIKWRFDTQADNVNETRYRDRDMIEQVMEHEPTNRTNKWTRNENKKS